MNKRVENIINTIKIQGTFEAHDGHHHYVYIHMNQMGSYDVRINTPEDSWAEIHGGWIEHPFMCEHPWDPTDSFPFPRRFKDRWEEFFEDLKELPIRSSIEVQKDLDKEKNPA